MANRKKSWLPNTPKRPKSQVPPAIKAEVEHRGNTLVESVIKPKHKYQAKSNLTFWVQALRYQLSPLRFALARIMSKNFRSGT